MEECHECMNEEVEESDGSKKVQSSTEEEKDEEQGAAESIDVLHTVVFECIGATKDMEQLLVLRQAKELLQEKEEVRVCL